MKIDISPKPELDIEHLNTAITVGTAKSPQYLIMNYSTFTSLRNQTDYCKEEYAGNVYYKYCGIKISLCEALEYGQIDIV